MKELKQSFSKVNPSLQDDNDTTTNFATEGGEKELDEKSKLAVEYGFDINSLDFSVEDLTLDELRAKFEEMKAADSAVTPADGDPEKDFALEGQFRG